MGTEAVGLLDASDVLQVVVHRLVLLGLLERDEEQAHILAFDRVPAFREQAPVVTLQGAVPHLHGGHTLNLRFLAEEHVGLVIDVVQRVRAVVLLDRLHERGVRRLRRQTGHLELAVRLHTERLVHGDERERGVRRRLEIAREREDPMEVLVALRVVLGGACADRDLLLRRVLRRAVEPDHDDGERDRRALVCDLGLQHRHVGQPGRLSGLVDAARHRLDVVHEQRCRADDGEVLLARPHQRVAGLVCAQLRVDEVDLDLAAPGDAAVGVDELGEGVDAVDRSLEQPGPGGVVDVGDHGDADGVGRDPDLTSRLLLLLRPGGRRRREQRPHEPQRANQHDPPSSIHGAPHC